MPLPQDVEHIVPESPSEITVTPAMAIKWLSNLGPNRMVDETTVARYAQAMSEGKWFLSIDAIKFTPDGRIVDGQHRLRAIVMADVSVNVLVIQVDEQPMIYAGRFRTEIHSVHIGSD